MISPKKSLNRELVRVDRSPGRMRDENDIPNQQTFYFSRDKSPKKAKFTSPIKKGNKKDDKKEAKKVTKINKKLVFSFNLPEDTENDVL